MVSPDTNQLGHLVFLRQLLFVQILHGQLFGWSQYVALLQLDQFKVQTVVSLFQFTELETGLAQPFRNHRNHTVCQHVAPPGYEITAAA